MMTHAKTKAGWINAFLIPVKQHVVCCGLLPAAVSLAGGSAGAQLLHEPAFELAMGLVVPPVVTYGTMWLEQKWHDRKGHGCCKTLTKSNYLKQTALSYLFYAAAAMLMPHDHDHGNRHKNCNENHAGLMYGGRDLVSGPCDREKTKSVTVGSFSPCAV